MIYGFHINLNGDLRKEVLFWTNGPMKTILTWCMIEKLKHSFNDKETYEV